MRSFASVHCGRRVVVHINKQRSYPWQTCGLALREQLANSAAQRPAHTAEQDASAKNPSKHPAHTETTRARQRNCSTTDDQSGKTESAGGMKNASEHFSLETRKFHSDLLDGADFIGLEVPVDDPLLVQLADVAAAQEPPRTLRTQLEEARNLDDEPWLHFRRQSTPMFGLLLVSSSVPAFWLL